MSEKGKTAILGLGLVIVGAVMLLRAIGMQLPSMEHLWPLIVIALGLISLYGAIRHKPVKPDSVWFGVTSALVGSFFAYITLGPGAWSDLRFLWPVFPLLAGIGWLCAYVADPRQVPNLVAAIIAGAVGVVGLLTNYGWLEPYVGRQLLDLWPLILVAIGAGLVVQSLLQRR